MTEAHLPPPVGRERPRVDSSGELYEHPAVLRYVWVALAALLALEAINEIFGVGGPPTLYQGWIHDITLVAATVVILWRAVFEPGWRSAWLLVGAASALWSIGTIGWSIAYGADPHPPFPSFADVLWLAWYPLMTWAMVRLIQSRLEHFDWHRWMDGIAVTLVILTAGVALVVEPAVDHRLQGTLATVVDFSYPLLDVLLVGAVLGVYGLLGWRPDRTWVLLGAGLLLMTGADVVFALQDVGGVGTDEHYAFLWAAGAVLLAYAAWVRAPGGPPRTVEVTGLRAVALPLIAQALAAAVQLYAFFVEIGRGERIVTVLVLIISSAQIVLSRPRPGSASPAVATRTERSARADGSAADGMPGSTESSTASAASPASGDSPQVPEARPGVRPGPETDVVR